MRARIVSLALASFLASVLATSTAFARDSGAPAFGAPGQISVNIDLPLGLSGPTVGILRQDPSNGPSTTIYAFQPSLDVFVIPHLSIGGVLGVAKGESSTETVGVTSSASVTLWNVGARVGYDFAFNGDFSLWPRLSLVYEHRTDTVRVGGLDSDVSGNALTFGIFAPVLWHPAQHFFLGAGPVFTTDFTRSLGNDDSKLTTYGLEGVIGGYFGGR